MNEKERRKHCQQCEHCDFDYLEEHTEGCGMFYLNRHFNCCDSFKRKENKKMSKNEELKKLARPLVDYIRKNYHPHVTVIVDSTHAEVLEGVAVVKFDYEEMK